MYQICTEVSGVVRWANIESVVLYFYPLIILGPCILLWLLLLPLFSNVLHNAGYTLHQSWSNYVSKNYILIMSIIIIIIIIIIITIEFYIIIIIHLELGPAIPVRASFNSLLKGPFAVYFSINFGEFVMYLFLISERYCCIILAIKCLDHWIKMYWLKPHSFLPLSDLTIVRLILLLYCLHFFVTAFDIIFSDYCLVFEVSHCRQARSVRFGDIMLVLNRKRTRLLPE